MQKSLTCLLVGEVEEEGEEEEVVGERRFQLSVHPVNVLHRERGWGEAQLLQFFRPQKFFLSFFCQTFF